MIYYTFKARYYMFELQNIKLFSVNVTYFIETSIWMPKRR